MPTLPVFAFPNKKILLVAAVLGSSLVLLGTFLYFGNARALATSIAGTLPQSSGDKVYLAAPAAVAVPTKEEAPMREMHIANNGLMLLRGATVISNSRGTIRVRMTWGSADFVWTVQTDSGTEFLTSKGVKQTREDIRVGDTVTITGHLIGNSTEPTIDATFVRE